MDDDLDLLDELDLVTEVPRTFVRAYRLGKNERRRTVLTEFAKELGIATPDDLSWEVVDDVAKFVAESFDHGFPVSRDIARRISREVAGYYSIDAVVEFMTAQNWQADPVGEVVVHQVKGAVQRAMAVRLEKKLTHVLGKWNELGIISLPGPKSGTKRRRKAS